MTEMEKVEQGLALAVGTKTMAPTRASIMRLSLGGSATVTSRQYAWRAVLYALLFTLGGRW